MFLQQREELDSWNFVDSKDKSGNVTYAAKGQKMIFGITLTKIVI